MAIPARIRARWRPARLHASPAGDPTQGGLTMKQFQHRHSRTTVKARQPQAAGGRPCGARPCHVLLAPTPVAIAAEIAPTVYAREIDHEPPFLAQVPGETEPLTILRPSACVLPRRVRRPRFRSRWTATWIPEAAREFHRESDDPSPGAQLRHGELLRRRFRHRLQHPRRRPADDRHEHRFLARLPGDGGQRILPGRLVRQHDRGCAQRDQCGADDRHRWQPHDGGQSLSRSRSALRARPFAASS